MCGIVGYIGDKNLGQVLIDGLKRLEYRGYDSAGICISSENLLVYKKRGRVSELESGLPKQIKGQIGIAHTRWATHGEPNEVNAHPHLDCKGEVAVVHNGIVENYQSLKELLIKEGHKFSSVTDTEVLVHLIEKFLDDDLEEAVLKALNLVEGTFGIAVVQKGNKKMVAVRRGSPLVIGKGKGEIFVASDVSAILEHTKKVVYLNDDEVAVLSKDNFEIKNLKGEKMDRKVEEIKWSIDEIEKSGFKHFMLKEIFNQPEALENTLRGRIKNGRIKLTVKISPKKMRRIILVACGTSWHAALIGKYYLESLTGLPVEVDYASEFRYRDPVIGKGDLVVALSQSGETADTLAAIGEAKRKGATTLGIVNVVGSTIAREVDSGVYVHAGPEIGVASTKAFSCQLAALLLLSLYIKQEKGEKLDQELVKNLKELPQALGGILKQSDKIRKLAASFVNSRNFLYLGRGIDFPVALEGALKLKEISYIHAEGYPAAEMKHGPIALIDQDMPVVFVVPGNGMFPKALSNMQEIKARRGKIIAIHSNHDEALKGVVYQDLKVPEVRDELTPLVNTIPLQLLAYHIADLKGIDVDKPRNLAKSVTVE